jgi:hypothetical protein
MHANEDIWEIRQIMIRKGTMVAKEAKEKEATMGMMLSRGLAAMAVTIGAVMSQVMTMTRAAMMVTRAAMTMTRAAITTGLVTMVTMTGQAAMIGLVVMELVI